MVEATTELLGGAAVTVFLALLFFGVVVLWDVALALRSVGDKIDKLEDNIDDDLTDIAHSLDGMSNTGGGGTQLHLNGGGTISSGPNASGPQQSQQSQQSSQQQGPAAQRAATDPAAAGGVGPQPQSQPHQPEQGPRAARRERETDDTTDNTDEAPEPDESVDETDDGSPDESAADEEPADEPEAEPDGDVAEAADPSHPRADANRGRFITSPDRTAWYATPLDRAAIAAARPEIAGELPAGTDDEVDESEVIAAGPVGSSEAVPDDETDADAAVDATVDESAGTDTDADAASADEADDGDDDGDESTAEDGLEDDGDDGDNGEIPTSPDEVDVLSFDEGADASGAAESDAGSGDTEADAPIDEGAVEPMDDTGSTADSGAGQSDVPDLTDGSTEPAPAGDEPTATAETDADADESAGATGSESEDANASDAPPADELGDLSFDDPGEFEPEDEDVTVKEAVDTMNEDAPAPELSSHRFDVTAEEIDGGGATLTFEFDTETVDITGSTERLLTYQMQSFADRESAPDGDVTIGRDRIVIEIFDSDGTAIQQWGEAAVDIIDRTLYLSDNSS
ncbi:AAA family ATPase [Natrinema sp. 74]|uniref:AAA family ATPase n=1 Tax=Natrinema sp. 74 TaxID=3384159 RepID=UPI0038D4EB2E